MSDPRSALHLIRSSPPTNENSRMNTAASNPTRENVAEQPLPTALFDQMQMLAWLDPSAVLAVRNFVRRRVETVRHDGVPKNETDSGPAWGWQSQQGS